MNLLIVGASAAERRADAASRLASARGVVTLDAASLPFTRPSRDVAAAGATLFIPEIHRAFPNHQAGGTRLVLTQSTYLLQKWIDTTAAAISATADRDELTRNAPEAFRGRGPWRLFESVELATTEDSEEREKAGRNPSLESGASVSSASPVVASLIRAYNSESPADRVTLCRQAVEVDDASPVAHLALASALRETNDMTGARAELDRTIALASDWEAAHYEDGKFWLGYDDITRARDAFQRACDLMPTFSAAFSNLGATVGELDDAEGALAAFRQALAHDPDGFPILNNIGVVSRELGELDESEAAFRRVVELAPEFVFGYYNLGHTLFLAARYSEALAAYEEGQRRDPEKNRRQGCRLAMMRLANGDAAGAERDLWRFADAAPSDEREDLLREAYEIANALVATRPELGTARPLLDRIGAEIGQ